MGHFINSHSGIIPAYLIRTGRSLNGRECCKAARMPGCSRTAIISGRLKRESQDMVSNVRN